MYNIILASKSPRRKELLENIGLEFTVIESDFDETNVSKDLDPHIYVEELSLFKAMSLVKNAKKNSLIIGADTVVEFNGQIIGKPRNRTEAYTMLKMLSGNVHHVYTGVSVVRSNDGKSYTSYEKTDVHFIELTDEMIYNYIDKYSPYDKAGGYGIQGYAGVFVNKIVGDYFNIVGLPVCLVNKILNEEFNEEE